MDVGPFELMDVGPFELMDVGPFELMDVGPFDFKLCELREGRKEKLIAVNGQHVEITTQLYESSEFSDRIQACWSCLIFRVEIQ